MALKRPPMRATTSPLNLLVPKFEAHMSLPKNSKHYFINYILLKYFEVPFLPTPCDQSLVEGGGLV